MAAGFHEQACQQFAAAKLLAIFKLVDQMIERMHIGKGDAGLAKRGRLVQAFSTQRGIAGERQGAAATQKSLAIQTWQGGIAFGAQQWMVCVSQSAQ